MTQVGIRVTALHSVENGVVKTYGDGVYIGDKVPDAPPFKEMGRENPCIQLDNGGYAWGFESWWGPVEDVRERLGDVEYVLVPHRGVEPVEET